MLAFLAMRGPSASKALKRRMELVKERHGDVIARQRPGADPQADGAAREPDRRLCLDPDPQAGAAAQAAGDDRQGHHARQICDRLPRHHRFSSSSLLLVQRRSDPARAVRSVCSSASACPHFVIGKMIKRRVAKFNVNFPDAIELMVRGLRSGLPITETLGIVAGEIPGPVGLEFRTVADKMKIGRTMEAALQETADRLGTPEFQFFVITLAIQRETGGNLAETLSNLADVLRKRAQMQLKIRAMSSESKASAYIVGSLPFIVFGLVWMINPHYMSGFFIDQRLMVAGLGGLCWMGIGAFIMAKMVNFEI